MTAVMVPATGATSGGSAVANNSHGEATILPGATETLVSFTAGTRLLRGFVANGDGDGTVWIELDGAPLRGLQAKIGAVKEAYRVLPNAQAYPSSATVVELKIRNDSSATSTFEAVLLGE